MDPLTAIRQAAEAKSLRPWTLARRGRLSVRHWQRLLDSDPETLQRTQWRTIRQAAEELGLDIQALQKP